MASNYIEWYLQLNDGRTGRPIDDDSGVYNVLTAGDPSEVTLYSNAQGTSQANPGTMTNGVIQFWTQSTVTSVDISILTSTGHAFFIQDAVQSNHQEVVWPENSGMYNLILPLQVVGASETVVDTGFDLLATMLVHNVFVHVTTLGTGVLLDVGTSTDPDGFVNQLAMAATGFPAAALEEALVSTSSALGELLTVATGPYVRKLHYRANTTSGANIVYTNTTVSSTAGEGYIYVQYMRVQTAG